MLSHSLRIKQRNSASIQEKETRGGLIPPFSSLGERERTGIGRGGSSSQKKALLECFLTPKGLECELGSKGLL